MIGGLILAAGEGRRFGGAKQLAPLEGRPLLAHAVAAAVAVPALERVVVALGSRSEAILEGVDFGRAEPLVVERWPEGQAASLAAGVRELREAEAIVVLLGDQPFVTPAIIGRMLALRGAAAPPPALDDGDEMALGPLALRATYGGRPGHPVVLERVLFEGVAQLRGDVGARELLAAVPVREVPCDDLGRGDDVDTPEALAAIRR